MHSEAISELIWHFAGHLHIAQDYTVSRLKYEEAAYKIQTSVYRPDETGHEPSPQGDLPELGSRGIRANYVPKYGPEDQIDWIPVETSTKVVSPAPHASMLKPIEVKLEHDAFGDSIHSVGRLHFQMQGGGHWLDQEGEASARDPIYTVEYADELPGKTIISTQLNVATTRDYHSDGGGDYSSLSHIDIGDSVDNMIDVASEFVPDLHLQPGVTEGVQFWTSAVAAQDEALKSGEREGEVLAPGRYVNGELQEETSSETEGASPSEPDFPTLPERAEVESNYAQVADLGGNELTNVAVIGDLNEAPATLIVMGDYYETNAIIQANVLQNRDQVLTAGSELTEVDSEGNMTENVATFEEKEFAAQAIVQGAVGDLEVKIDFVDGDFFDIKALTQRNYIDDGDVVVQNSHAAYIQVTTGGNGQANAALIEDWGKHYDLIIVLGDYHAANIITQTNILLDNDVVGQGASVGEQGCESDSGSGGTIYTGQNYLLNEATISHYGESMFAGIDGDLQALIDAISNQETVSSEAWSDLYGAISGTLNVLFVTGNYYDLNVISQVNVIADADLAVQMSHGSSMQWVSTGGNSLVNSAEIIDARGLRDQYLGGNQYEDSVLIQTEMVADASQSTPMDPTALIPELVAFLEQPQDNPAEGEGWITNTYSNHDSFGHVLS